MSQQHRVPKWILCLSVVMVGAGLCGCSSYTVPGRGASIDLMSASGSATSSLTPGNDPSAQSSGGDIEITRRRATASFPAHIVVVRIQEPGYKSMTNEGVGGGRYSVIAVRDIENRRGLRAFEPVALRSGNCAAEPSASAERIRIRQGTPPGGGTSPGGHAVSVYSGHVIPRYGQVLRAWRGYPWFRPHNRRARGHNSLGSPA